MSGPARSRLGVAVMVLAAGLALTGCSNSRIPVQSSLTPPDDTAVPLTTPSQAGVATATDGTSPDAAAAAQAGAGAELAGRLSIQAGELPAPWQGMKVQLSPNGDSLTGKSLDNCGYVFPSEKYRVARRLSGVYNAAGKEVGVYNEVIVYDSDGHAGQAMREWRASVGNCHKGSLIKPAAKGQPKTRVDLETTATDASLPVAQNTVTSLEATVLGPTRTRMYAKFLIQARGAVLDVVLAFSPTPLTAGDTAGLTSLAKATGTRLYSS